MDQALGEASKLELLVWFAPGQIPLADPLGVGWCSLSSLREGIRDRMRALTAVAPLSSLREAILYVTRALTAVVPLSSVSFTKLVRSFQ